MTGFVDPVEVRSIENELQKDVQRLLNSFVVNAVVEEEEKNGKA